MNRFPDIVAELRPRLIIIIIIIILMTREAFKSIKYELCNLKAECTNLAKEFMIAVPGD